MKPWILPVILVFAASVAADVWLWKAMDPFQHAPRNLMGKEVHLLLSVPIEAWVVLVAVSLVLFSIMAGVSFVILRVISRSEAVKHHTS